MFCGEKHKQQKQFKCTAVIGYSIKRYQDVGTESKQEAELALVIPAASASHLNNQNSARGPSLTLTHSMLRAAAAARETTMRWTDLCGATGNTYNYSPRTRGTQQFEKVEELVLVTIRHALSPLIHLHPNYNCGAVGIFFSFCECVNTLRAGCCATSRVWF